MTLFLDASALAAVIRDEPERLELEARIDADASRLTSGLALWETARALGRNADPLRGSLEVERYRAALDIVVVPIGEREAEEAMRAHARYGKGSGHAAKLNMGDCFAYACAKTNGARLLYKGDDFVHTDLG